MKSESVDQFYNVGTGIRTSLKELAEILLELTGSTGSINYAPRSQATFVKNRIGCPIKATNEIGYSAKVELREGLKKLIEWRKDHISEVEARRNKAS